MLTTKTHAVLDYLVGILLIAAPWVLNFADGSLAQQIPVTLGIITIVMSLLTRYEFSLFKIINFKAHLIVDFLSGAFLAASPWLFGFSDRVYLPHVLVGIVEICVVLLTQKAPVLNLTDKETAAGSTYTYSKK
jgi:hypothetical protein